MELVDHGTRGSHYGAIDADMVLHKGTADVHLTEGEAYQLCHLLLQKLNEE